LRVNSIDVAPFVDTELNRRFPGRAERRAEDPDGLRAAWAALERTWAATLDRAAAMPAGTVDVSVGGEWSFAQTLRHLVHATDVWLGRGVMELEQPFHPLGLMDEGGGFDMSVSTTDTPTYAEVLVVRASHVAMVRDFLAAVTPEDLDAARKNPHNPEHPETVRSCLHVILEEEWEHHRFAVRDLRRHRGKTRRLSCHQRLGVALATARRKSRSDRTTAASPDSAGYGDDELDTVVYHRPWWR
jgi:hypothetical protein